MKNGCTTAMLQCLDGESRFVFVLGNIFGFDSPAGAEICGITEEAYRQRLSRAGKKIRNFMNRNCGLINENAECRCRKRLKIAFDRGRIDPERLLYKTEEPKIRDCLREMNEIDAISRVYRDNPFVDRRDLFREDLAERMNIRSSFFRIMGRVSTAAAVRPISREISKLFIDTPVSDILPD